MKEQLLSLVLPLLIILDCSQGRVFRVSKMECRSLDPSFTYFKTCKVVRRENGRAALYVIEVFLYKDPIDDIVVSWKVNISEEINEYLFYSLTLVFLE